MDDLLMIFRNLGGVADPVRRLRALRQLRAAVLHLLDEAEVTAARAAKSGGASWEDIGRALGENRATVMRRYGSAARTQPKARP